MPVLLLFVLLFIQPVSTKAQDASFSFGRSLFDLQNAIRGDQQVFPEIGRYYEVPSFTPRPDAKNSPGYGIFIPRWSAEDLPFFCKIEHDWAKSRGRIPIKFRLGSVDYVDWLEGKSWDKTRY